jgi:hypothetical protein
MEEEDGKGIGAKRIAVSIMLIILLGGLVAWVATTL